MRLKLDLMQRNVHHRVDGLETAKFKLLIKLVVHHRVDGLEIESNVLRIFHTVHHRVDGLENQCVCDFLLM